MDGMEFYEFLKYTYVLEGQKLYGNFTFNSWLFKPKDSTYSFRFNILNQNPKAIPRNILIEAWNANLKIDDNWLNEKFKLKFHNDCRLHILNFLLKKYHNLR